MNKQELIETYGSSDITITSSCGDFKVSYEGIVLTPLPEEYEDIALMDIPRLEAMCNANNISLFLNNWDILAVAYWTDDGEYDPPATDYSEIGCMRFIWNGTVDEYDDAINYMEVS